LKEFGNQIIIDGSTGRRGSFEISIITKKIEDSTNTTSNNHGPPTKMVQATDKLTIYSKLSTGCFPLEQSLFDCLRQYMRDHTLSKIEDAPGNCHIM
jgi:hypothetical protein